MKTTFDDSGFDRAMSELEARVAAVAMAVVQASAQDMHDDLEHQFGDEAEIGLESGPDGLAVTVAGSEPVLREFGSTEQPARPWLNETMARAATKLRQRGQR